MRCSRRTLQPTSSERTHSAQNTQRGSFALLLACGCPLCARRISGEREIKKAVETLSGESNGHVISSIINWSAPNTGEECRSTRPPVAIWRRASHHSYRASRLGHHECSSPPRFGSRFCIYAWLMCSGYCWRPPILSLSVRELHSRLRRMAASVVETGARA